MFYDPVAAATQKQTPLEVHQYTGGGGTECSAHSGSPLKHTRVLVVCLQSLNLFSGRNVLIYVHEWTRNSASFLKMHKQHKSLKKWPWVHALASSALFASGQTRNVDLQACTATQMWNQTASVMVDPSVCGSTVFFPCPYWPSCYPTPPHLLPLHPVHLSSLSLPHTGSRSCSIPAGPCLFISSEAAMINEALNTSSLSPGPGEPHSWVNRPSRCSTLLPRSWVWGGSTGNPRTTGSNSRDLSQVFREACSTKSVAATDPTKSNLGVSGWEHKEKHPGPSVHNMCGTHVHTHERLHFWGLQHMLWLQIYDFLTCSLTCR